MSDGAQPVGTAVCAAVEYPHSTLLLFIASHMTYTRRFGFLAAAVLAASLFVLLPRTSSALSCMAPLYPEIAAKGAIVVGTVTDVQYASDTGGLKTNRVTVSVERGWGNAAQTMTFMNPLRRIWTGRPEGGEPIPFQMSQRYLIVLGYGQSGSWEASLGDCSTSFLITTETQLQNFIDARVADGMGSGTMFTKPSCTTDDCGTPAPAGYCPRLVTTITRGARDAATRPIGQVSELQRFLSDYFDVDPDDIVTGYFGRITHSYVVRFQQEQKLPAFGIVGSMTRTATAQTCRDVR